MYVGIDWKVLKLKSSWYHIDDFFGQWNPRTATLMEEMCGPHRGLYWKINFIWPYSMNVLVSLWTFHIILIYIYIYIYMMRKISGNRSSTDNRFSNDISPFIQKRKRTKHHCWMRCQSWIYSLFDFFFSSCQIY